jgi:drug/metabolite transporter (DMT)-like permease
MADNQTSDLAQAIQEVTERASLLVREEIELAKAEMAEKVKKLVAGAVVGIVAGVFFVAGLIYLLHAAAWGIWALIGNTRDFWLGFAIVAVALFLLGGLAGFIAFRAIKRGSPPTPAMAIEEGRLIKETVSTSRPATPLGPAGTVPAPTATDGHS